MVAIIAHRIATVVISEVGVETTANGRAQLLTTREASLLGVTQADGGSACGAGRTSL
ncbi:MAG: hypothetical protein H0T97_07975 [Actinobacteria bacterium]|nr:hypothetical protein [Actinomycetota bacterium]